MSSGPESLYRRGVVMWADRDLDGALELLESVVADSSIAGEDTWWFSASRAIAKIAMEADDLDRAERHLRRFQDSSVGAALTVALRGRRWLLLGEPDWAAVEISSVLEILDADSSDDSGSLMNGAIALAECAEVLVDLGYGHEATAVAVQARARTRQAQVTNRVVDAMLSFVEAAAARLCDDADLAEHRLAAVDTGVSEDLAVLVIRERARLAWDAGDRATAMAYYDAARAHAEATGYASLARMITAEVDTGPPPPRTGLDIWIEERSRREMQQAQPYAVVVRLAVDADADRFNDLEARVSQMLEAKPELGLVDGIGTDGDVWELFLTGDQPDELWAAVRPLVQDVDPAPGSEVEVRRDGSVETTPLAQAGPPPQSG